MVGIHNSNMSSPMLLQPQEPAKPLVQIPSTVSFVLKKGRKRKLSALNLGAMTGLDDDEEEKDGNGLWFGETAEYWHNMFLSKLADVHYLREHINDGGSCGLRVCKHKLENCIDCDRMVCYVRHPRCTYEHASGCGLCGEVVCVDCQIKCMAGCKWSVCHTCFRNQSHVGCAVCGLMHSMIGSELRCMGGN